MAKGEDTSKHPNRRVSRADMLFGQLQGMIEGTVAPQKSLAKMWASLPADNDDAPAGGIPRPQLNTCPSCGEKTPNSGNCADCN